MGEARSKPGARANEGIYFVVRDAEARDALALCALNEAFNGVARAPQDVEGALAAGGELVAVADTGGGVVAFACAQVTRSFCYGFAQGEITEMYVREAWRGRGVAGLLIANLEERMVRLGVGEVKILAHPSREALRAYQKAGYELDDDAVLHKQCE